MFFRALILASTGVLLSACASGGPGNAQSGDSNTRAFIRAAGTWDFDRDGTVTCQEWKDYAARQFKAGDANADGVLDAGEYKSLSSRDSLFGSIAPGFFDSSGDNRITQAEFIGKPNPAFSSLDVNKDCGLTIAELAVVPNRKRASKLTDGDLFPGEARGEAAKRAY